MTAQSQLPNGPDGSTAQLALRWNAEPLALLRECADTYGDPFTLPFPGGERLVVFSDPAAIRTILTAPPGAVSGGPATVLLRPIMGDRALFYLEGDEHLAHRRLVRRPLDEALVRSRGRRMQAAVAEQTRRWSPGAVLDARAELQRISLRIMAEAVLGAQGEALDATERALLAVLGTDLMVLAVLRRHAEGLNAGPWVAFRARRAVLEELIDAAVERLGEENPPDEASILAALVAGRDEVDPPLDAVGLRDHVISLLVAGHETTAVAIAWALHWIHADDAVEAWLRAALASLGPGPSPDALAGLAELDAVCREALRIVPIIPVIGRQLLRPMAIGGVELPAGVIAAPSVYLVHHRPDLYPEPDRFRPQRFLERTFGPYEYLPFGGGARRCLGMSFGLHEMKVVLGTILAAFRLEAVSPRSVRPVRAGVTLAPDGGPRLRIAAVVG